MPEFPLLAEVPTTAAQRNAFRTGALRERWAETYAPPGLFDADDLRIARTQPGSHFYEWLVAVTLFETMGWLSLVEKYQFAHERKQEVLRSLGADALVRFVAGQRLAFGSLQAPDLLVYAPDFSDYFLCEVKGPTDRLRPEQARYFRALREAAGRPIFVARVTERAG